jgi:hypothetical protein
MLLSDESIYKVSGSATATGIIRFLQALPVEGRPTKDE